MSCMFVRAYVYIEAFVFPEKSDIRAFKRRAVVISRWAWKHGVARECRWGVFTVCRTSLRVLPAASERGEQGASHSSPHGDKGTSPTLTGDLTS